MKFRHFFIVLGVVSALAFVSAAQAANLVIDDSVEAQITLTQDPNWEFGVISNGFPFPSRVSGSTTAPGEVAMFFGSWIANSPGNPSPGTGIIYFVDQAKKHSCRSHDRRSHDRRFDRYRHHGHHKHHRGACISDIVSASWTTVGRTATIAFTIVSSPCGRNLGPLPPAFAGLGVPDPTAPIQIGGLFRNPGTGVPVAIPSNLTVQFVGNDDRACDDEDDD